MKILYFAYGANRTQEMMNWITGKTFFLGKPAVLHNWMLCIQKLSQVPTIVVPFFPNPAPFRDVMQKKWGDNFETYIMTPGTGSVRGTLWELDTQDRELVKNWERVGPWYKEVIVEVECDGKLIKAISECLGEGQEYDRIVNGLDYEPFMLPRHQFKQVAIESRINFYKRKGINNLE